MCGNKWFRILKQVEMESCMNILNMTAAKAGVKQKDVKKAT